MGTSIDTSGFVTLRREDAPWKGLPHPDIYWVDLLPFAQGYVEALLRDFVIWSKAPTPRLPLRRVGFSDLAPETLALILKDCEARLAIQPYDMSDAAHAGRAFWEHRAEGSLAVAWRDQFPPLTRYLSDDGRVYLIQAPTTPAEEA